MTIKQILITSLLLPLLVVSSAFIPDTAKAQTETGAGRQFPTPGLPDRRTGACPHLPECDEILTDEFVMSPEEKKAALKNCSAEGCTRMGLGVHRKEKGAIQGYAIITEEIGKFHPFTFVVGVDMDGEITNIAVLVYRETRRRDCQKRFLSVSREILRKSGIQDQQGYYQYYRSYHVRAVYVCEGVRKVIAVINEYYLER